MLKATFIFQAKPQKKSNPTRKAPVKGPGSKDKENQTWAKLQLNAKRQVSSQALAQEKQRLQELEKQLATRIKQYKDSQTKQQKEKQKAAISPQRLVPENIKTEEKMVFDFGADVEKEMVTITPHRRHSLLGKSPTTKPQLTPSPAVEPLVMESAVVEDAEASAAGAGDDAAAVAGAVVTAASVRMQTGMQVDMPTGAALERLRKHVVSCSGHVA